MDLPYIGQTRMIPTAIRNCNSQFSDKLIRLSYGTLTQVLTPEISVQTSANGIMATRYEGSEVFIQMLTLANYKHERFATTTVEPLRGQR